MQIKNYFPTIEQNCHINIIHVYFSVCASMIVVILPVATIFSAINMLEKLHLRTPFDIDTVIVKGAS